MKKSAKLVMLAVLTLVLAVPTMAVSQDMAQATKSEATGAAKGLRVFFASHSLMWYVPTPLGELAKTAGINDHKLVALQSLGGSKTQQHWDMAEAKNEAKRHSKRARWTSL